MSRCEIYSRYCPSLPKNSFQNRNSYISSCHMERNINTGTWGVKQDTSDEPDPIAKP